MTASLAPLEERLLAYAAGTLRTPEAAVLAAHLALRPTSGAWVRTLQAIGGDVLEDLPPAPLDERALEQALARVEADSGEAAAPARLNDMPELPEPLRRCPLGPWRWIGPGIHVRDVLGLRDGDCRVILLKVDPGCAAPMHTHEGLELTCVIAGSYATNVAEYGPGDVEEADPSVHHTQRVTSDDPCLCVVALEGQLRYGGWMGWLFNRFVRL